MVGEFIECLLSIAGAHSGKVSYDALNGLASVIAHLNDRRVPSKLNAFSCKTLTGVGGG